VETEFFSAAFLSALLAIVLIDLVLAGDNALIIGLVARNLPKDRQRQVIFWGTFGAIATRALMAIVVVWILNVPGFMLAGGIALVWIARKLLTPEEEGSGHAGKAPAATFAGAVRTIVVADAVMGIDNVLAIGGAASGSVLLIVLGLAISVPIIVWGSHLVIKLVDRYPSVILLGGAVLAWTAYSMIVREPLLEPWWSERLGEKMKPMVVLFPSLLIWLLAFEVAASVMQVQVDYLLATTSGASMLEGLRWIGWLPFAAGYLWLREQYVARDARRAVRS
jgi:YjbE family integral membrane protein